MTILYDYIVIGSGISGCYVANKLNIDFPNSKVLVLTKDDKIGGVWHKTKWSWLCSDTPAIFYTPDEYLPYINSKYYNTTNGVKGKHIKKVIKQQTENINFELNTEVYSLNFLSEQNIWNVKTSNNVFSSRFIINCTGLFQTPNVPIEYSNYLRTHNINFCHSSQFNDRFINKHAKIAVIGSRSSGFQIVKELSKTNKIDWYARSFNNIYLDVNSPNKIVSTSIYMYTFLLDNKINVSKINDYIAYAKYGFLHYVLKLKDIKYMYFLNIINDNSFLKELNVKNCNYDFTTPIKPIVINCKDLEQCAF